MFNSVDTTTRHKRLVGGITAFSAVREIAILIMDRDREASMFDIGRFGEMFVLLSKFFEGSDRWVLLEAVGLQCFNGKKGKNGRLFFSDREDWAMRKSIVEYFEFQGWIESRQYSGNPELKEYKRKHK